MACAKERATGASERGKETGARGWDGRRFMTAFFFFFFFYDSFFSRFCFLSSFASGCFPGQVERDGLRRSAPVMNTHGPSPPGARHAVACAAHSPRPPGGPGPLGWQRERDVGSWRGRVSLGAVCITLEGGVGVTF